MLSKNQTKLITSLQQKKYRIEHQFFVAEGIKVVKEFLDSTIELENLYCTIAVESLYNSYHPQIVSEKELSKISDLATPNKVVGVFKIPKTVPLDTNGLIVALDGINDPGNLGTIIRLCDWFGVSQIICSSNTVDCYNSKVVQASMGSLSRISIQYTHLETFLTNTTLPIYAAVMDGNSLQSINLESNAILVMGNESNGISKNILALIQHQLTIDKFGKNTVIDSLNVATATAILLHEFRRGS